MTRSKEATQGFTLIEALVALAVLSVGLLGLAALQATATDFTNNSYYRTQATIHANAYIERMRANPAGVAAGLYRVTDSLAVVCAAAPTKYCAEDVSAPTSVVASCTPTELASADIYAVACGVPTGAEARGGLDDQLPASTLQVICPGGVCDNTTLHTITITWDETEQGNLATKTVTMTVMP